MKIITHGCSFTKNHLPCWPKFVEWFTDHEVVNRGYADSSNETISRDAINSAIEFKSGISHMYIMWSANDKFEYYKTLEHILRTQHFLSNYSLRYTMMICKQSVLSDIEHNLYNEIDWDKFIFYNQNKGLHEYSLDNFKEYYNPGDLDFLIFTNKCYLQYN